MKSSEEGNLNILVLLDELIVHQRDGINLLLLVVLHNLLLASLSFLIEPYDILRSNGLGDGVANVPGKYFFKIQLLS